MSHHVCEGFPDGPRGGPRVGQPLHVGLRETHHLRRDEVYEEVSADVEQVDADLCPVEQ